jgi:hypothetical protein
MNNVIDPQFDKWKPDEIASFTLSAQIKPDGGWAIDVIDFYDRTKNQAEIYREIASYLVSISGGMMGNAEEIAPTQRGPAIRIIILYGDTTAEIVGPAFETAEQHEWLATSLVMLGTQMKSPNRT